MDRTSGSARTWLLLILALGCLLIAAGPTLVLSSAASRDRMVIKRDPSGAAMPVGDVPGWHQVFADNFARENVPVGAFSGCRWPRRTPITRLNCRGLAAYPNVEAKWFAYPDGWTGTPSTGTYEPSKVISIHNGVMDYHLHTVGRSHMIAAAVPKIPGGSGLMGGFRYGRFVARARIAPLYGYHVSFLLWPDSNIWPRDREIDFPEADFDSRTISGFVHWPGATGAARQTAYDVAVNLSRWHIYEVDWTAAGLSFYVDGVLIGRTTAPTEIPRTLMHWVLQTGTSFTEGAPMSTASGDVQIDWVTAYRPE